MNDSFMKSRLMSNQYAKIEFFRRNVIKSQITFRWTCAHYLNIR